MTLLTVVVGLILGGVFGYGLKSRKLIAAQEQRDVLKFDPVVFDQLGTTDATLALAKQLAQADAEKCAALGRAMLGKRIMVLVQEDDPFASVGNPEHEEVMLPERVWEGLFKRWMQVSPTSAWEFVMANHSDALPLRKAALRQWALHDPAAAVRAAGTEISNDEKGIILRSYLYIDPLIGLKLAKDWNYDGSTSDPFQSEDTIGIELLVSYAEKSPIAAMEWCHAHCPDQVSAVSLGWLQADAAGCMTWIKSQPIELQKHMMQTICDAPNVTVQSIRYLSGLCEAGEKWASIGMGILTVAKQDDYLAQSLIDELIANPTDRLAARNQIAEEFSREDPRKAMEFLLPSLSVALPLFEVPEIGMPESFTSISSGSSDSFALSGNSALDTWEKYIMLGAAAGVGREEVLHVLGQVHPQYHYWLLNHSLEELIPIMGPHPDWLQPFVENATREELEEYIYDFNYDTPDAALRGLETLSSGLLKDVLSERYIELLLENNEPVESVLARAQHMGGERLDLSVVYEYWIVSEPEKAMMHLQTDPNATPDDWAGLIYSGYSEHGSAIEQMAENLPAGDFRNQVVQTLSTVSLGQSTDYVTAMYWATEIGSKAERLQQMREVFNAWQQDREATLRADMIEGIQQNIENSALGAEEKALWLERIESEVRR